MLRARRLALIGGNRLGSSMLPMRQGRMTAPPTGSEAKRLPASLDSAGVCLARNHPASPSIHIHPSHQGNHPNECHDPR
ncbi:MAG: hypothetical protein Q4G62_04780, partial [Pseudomonadota bacterium]|nr:hypothetical protein [Pseudomonadota bacterium]